MYAAWNFRRPVLLTVLALSASVVACVSHDDIESLQLAQKDMQARLEKLERARTQPPVPQQPRGPDATKSYAVSVGKSPVLGNKDAWVTIVEISDFQCPFCSRGAATVKEVEKKYKGDVRVVFKHNPLPFHPRAMPAAVAAVCAGQQGKFWPLADDMFAEQSKLGDDDLLKLASKHGVEEGPFKACLAAAETKAVVAEDMALAAKFGARGTPAFFINGRFLSGAQPAPAFEALVDEELKKAKDSKVAKGSYYAQQIEQKGEQAL